MKIKDLIDILDDYDPDMEVYTSDGVFLKPFTVQKYSGHQLVDWLDLWDTGMVKYDYEYLVFVLED